ncbi:MAG: hypothetical protein AAGL98_10940, partial [Planctomycetota bacterium]
MLSLIRDTGAQGVLFLSGDRHHAELSVLDAGRVEYPLYDLTSSGLNQSRVRSGGWRVPELNRARRAGPFRGHHFGMVTIDWRQSDPAIRLEIIDGQGRAAIHETLHLSELRRADGPARVAHHNNTSNGRAESAAAAQTQITIDGDIDEWRTPGLLDADAEHLYGRFPTTLRTLRRHAEMVTVGFDLDGDPTTGQQATPRRGIDLEFQIGPPRGEDGRRRRGPLAVAYGPKGNATAVDDVDLRGALGFHVGPTNASAWHEFRLRRDAAERLGMNPPAAGDTVAVVINATHKETGESRLIAQETITLNPDAPTRHAEPRGIPAKADGAVRLMAFNVLWATPQEDPAPFARLLRATRPDIYLIQEWDQQRYSVAEITAWFAEHVDPD